MTFAAALADRLDPPVSPYIDDPVGWVEHRLGGFLWSKQREIMEALRDHRKVAVRSCHDAGKSFVAAAATAWWIDSRPIGQAFVASTAPSYKQVNAILWEEIRRAHRKGKLQGRVSLDDEWRIGETLVGYGRKPADHDEHGFQGIHRRWVLAILDEACGIPPALWTGVEAITTNEDCRILAIGNPDDPGTQFAEVCKPGSGWHVIGIDGYETPNFTGEEIPTELRHLLLSREWVEDKKNTWGEESPLFISKVRGEFPDDAADGVVPGSWVIRCAQERYYHGPLEHRPVELGVDVGAGGDESVIYGRFGPQARLIERDRNPDTMRTTGLVMKAIEETGATVVKVDEIGIGKGVVDRLREQRAEGRHEASIIGVNVGRAASDPRHYVRLRDQIWWEVGRGLSETGGWDLSQVDDETIAQLTAPKFTYDSSGRVKIESKDETRARIKRSPDLADALLLAFFTPGGGRAGSINTAGFGPEPEYVSGDIRRRGKKYIDQKPR